MECGVERIWSDWKTVKLLGEGSFGKVYEIVRDQFGLLERSAVKVISIPTSPSEVQSLKSDGMTMENITDYYEAVVRDFVQEIMMMSKLRGHMNIVGYEDYKVVKREGAFGWDIYIRMELLTSLTAHMEAMQGADPDATVSVNGKIVKVFDETDVVNMAIDMCAALEACSARHIVHRDIKPDNIFVSEDGHYKLGDFGVAKTVEKTVSGLSKKGTPTYMAPEIYKGEPGGLNSDIYSLGIVMYKLLNDNREPFLPPFPQTVRYEHKQQALARRMNGEALPRTKTGSDTVWEIVQKACACHAHERWQNPTALKNALLSVLKDDEVKPAPKPAVPSTPSVDQTVAVSKVTPLVDKTRVEVSTVAPTFQTLTVSESKKQTSPQKDIKKTPPSSQKYQTLTVGEERHLAKQTAPNAKTAAKPKQSFVLLADEPEKEGKRESTVKDETDSTKNSKRGCALAVIAGIMILAISVIFITISEITAISLMVANELQQSQDIVSAQTAVPDDNRDTIHVPNDVEIGTVVTFGTYEQDGNLVNNAENIQWIVLDKQDGKALVISRYLLDYQPYNEIYTEITWETSTLRKWLNSTFLKAAFSIKEQDDIVTTAVLNEGNAYHGIDGGNDTQDKVFLLSIDEVERYFPNAGDRNCETSPYDQRYSYGQEWWLRSPGYSQTCAAISNSDSGNVVSDNKIAVRPAMWVTLE